MAFAILLIAALQVRVIAAEELVTSYPSLELHALDSYVAIDHASRLVEDTKHEPTHVKYGVGAGGRIALVHPFEQSDVNHVALTILPRNSFDTTSFGLFYRARCADAGSATEPMRLVGTRRTSGNLTEVSWTVDRPFSECVLGLPMGASFVIESLQLSRVVTTPRSGAFILSSAFLLLALWLAGRVVHRRENASVIGTLVFLLCWLVNMGVALWLSSLGHNDSVESYRIVAHVVNNGEVVYALTSRYNYGVLWSYIAAMAMALHDWFGLAGPETFHVLVAGLLCLPNLLIGIILGRCYSLAAGTIYALLPPLLLITGFHSAIENLGISLALLAWVVIVPESRRRQAKFLVLSAIVMGFSLIAKHYMAFFPVWILLWKGLGPWRRRLAYVAGVYGLFLVHFVPFALDDSATRGILENVFGYGAAQLESLEGGPRSLISRVLWPLLGSISHPALTCVWVGAIVLVGWMAVRGDSVNAFPVLYLVVLTALAPNAGDQYLVAPLLACAVFYYRFSSWGYVAAASVALLASGLNITSVPAVAEIVRLPDEVTPWGIDLHRWDVPQLFAVIMLLDVLLVAPKRRLARAA